MTGPSVQRFPRHVRQSFLCRVSGRRKIFELDAIEVYEEMLPVIGIEEIAWHQLSGFKASDLNSCPHQLLTSGCDTGWCELHPNRGREGDGCTLIRSAKQSTRIQHGPSAPGYVIAFDTCQRPGTAFHPHVRSRRQDRAVLLGSFRFDLSGPSAVVGAQFIQAVCRGFSRAKDVKAPQRNALWLCNCGSGRKSQDENKASHSRSLSCDRPGMLGAPRSAQLRQAA